MLVAQSALIDIARSICSSMLGAEIEETCGSPADSSRRLTGYVHITGGSKCAVLLEATEEFVNQAASALLGTPAAEMTQRDRLDCIAELTNMFGGNLKSILPAPSSLSLPSVIVGNRDDVLIAHSSPVADASLIGFGQGFHVRVVAETSDQHAPREMRCAVAVG